jgi:hypothetical protein
MPGKYTRSQPLPSWIRCLMFNLGVVDGFERHGAVEYIAIPAGLL